MLNNTQENILENQLEVLKRDEVFVLGGISLFLIDYFGEKLYAKI